MFKDITLKNFRTHKQTKIELHPVTLFIGNNNSGKTNFLAGIQHFCRLARRARPGHLHRTVIAAKDLYPHQHKFATEQPIACEINWANLQGEINYEMQIYKNEQFKGKAGCRERIRINLFSLNESTEITSGYEKSTDIIALRGDIENSSSLSFAVKKLCGSFFRDLAYTFDYHFQPLIAAFSEFEDQVGIGEVSHQDILILTTDAERSFNQPDDYFKDWGCSISKLLMGGVEKFYSIKARQGYSCELLPIVIPVVTFPSTEIFVAAAKNIVDAKNYSKKPRDLKLLLYGTAK